MNTAKGTDVQGNKIDLNETSNTTSKTKTSSSEAVTAIKNALKDKKWLKENAMMKESCFVDTPIKHEQTLTFMVLKNKNGNNPMIAVKASSEEDLSAEVFVVWYENGKVLSNSIRGTAFHINHGDIEIDPNNLIAKDSYIHMGYFGDEYYDISKGKSVSLNYIGYEVTSGGDESEDEVSNYYIAKGNTDTGAKVGTKSEYDKINSKYSSYKFSSIDTQLNNTNIDKYIK